MKISWIDRQARKILVSKMSGIKGGRITIQSDRTDAVGELNGDNLLLAKVTVKNPHFFRKILLGGSTGAGESYIKGDWETDDLVSLLSIFKINEQAYENLDGGWACVSELVNHIAHAFNKNTKDGSRKNISEHYDLGNDFFQLFLDETMAYSSGLYESETSTLKEASIAKFDRLCHQLELKSTDKVVEIGTGWGGFAVHAAENYGCEIVTTTISEEQYRKASELVQEKKLGSKIKVVKQDYREMDGVYDKLVSIEMIEAVGHRFLDTYIAKCGSLLKADGMMAIQAITVPDHRYDKHKYQSSFINKYIFPGSCLLSRKAITDSAKRMCGMHLVDEYDMTQDYARTLKAWRERFFANIDKVRKLGLSEDFIRMWDFYLSYSEAGFRHRWIGDYQLVYTKQEITPEETTR